MKTTTILKLTSLALGVLFIQAGTAAPLADKQWSMLETYCSECHNQDDFSGGIAFELSIPDGFHVLAEMEQERLRLAAAIKQPK